MESKIISDLAKLLRKDGDKILNEKCRLTLSGPILNDLNEAFCLIAERDVYNTTFQVIPANNMKAEIFLDLQFLHDFVQKTLCLSITEDLSSKKNYNVDISKFRNLRSLEVHKIPILTVRGLQSLRAQLQSLTCIRCVDNIKDILSSCGADHSTGFVWSELKEAKFSYNCLQSIDSSLEYLPWLQVLDLSHNRIVTAEALKWLPNLKYINLSYNKLEEIPMFHVESGRKLQILKISNNDIETITGVNRLEALCELDLANNYIIDHSNLVPVSYLPHLRWLTLAGNPLSFHPEHRKLTAKYLHRNAGTIKFCLDQIKLSKVENNLTGSYKIAQRLQRSPRKHLNSVSSTQSNETSASESTASDIRIFDSSLSRLKPIKTVKVRNAIIADLDDDNNLDSDGNQTRQSNSLHDSTTSANDTSEDMSHLETKRQLTDLRSQFGDAWLHSQGGSLVQHILGMTPMTGVTGDGGMGDGKCGAEDSEDGGKDCQGQDRSNDHRQILRPHPHQRRDKILQKTPLVLLQQGSQPGTRRRTPRGHRKQQQPKHQQPPNLRHQQFRPIFNSSIPEHVSDWPDSADKGW
ncbi:serine/threonine-protein kinase 11-interacting protein-like [Ctenocephalides felis]|uniref:serine/threonine-protein kinase 11-interacting protein-like n=1 Tax=Ctenocephalides felis TaxID=7515 RepID=UPI000E6E1BE2|nr:serine/threonine-protein kinase 11-interacting protein-like [Ctenocephalides felis]